MGFIICEKHGGNGIVLCCEHIAEAVNSTSKQLQAICINIDLLGDKNELFEHYVCESCGSKYKLNEGMVLGDEAWGNRKIMPADYPVCCKCFEEYMEFPPNA